MKYSRIKAKANFHKCLSDLVHSGYIYYKPSINKLGSLIKFTHYPTKISGKNQSILWDVSCNCIIAKLILKIVNTVNH